jgi:secreted Zn-dependent insulinase-like peptidase
MYSKTNINYLIKNNTSVNKTIYNLNPNNKETGICCGIYMGNFPEDDCSYWEVLKPLCILLNNYISDKFSNLMRTEKQLGYVANTTLININEDDNTQLHQLFIIQTNVDNCKEIIYDYIKNILSNDIQSITEKQFESLKNGMYLNLTEQPHNIINEIEQNFKELKQNKLDYKTICKFHRKRKMAKCVSKFDRRLFINFFKSLDKIIHCVELKPKI